MSCYETVGPKAPGDPRSAPLVAAGIDRDAPLPQGTAEVRAGGELRPDGRRLPDPRQATPADVAAVLCWLREALACPRHPAGAMPDHHGRLSRQVLQTVGVILDQPVRDALELLGVLDPCRAHDTA